MSSLLSADLAAACSALGYFDVKSNKYYADSNTLETVKDLIRYLRRDDEEFEIRRHLGAAKVLQTDLLPLLKSYWEENDLFDVLLRLIVNLTTPALVLWNEDLPAEKIARNYYLQIEEHLQNYKEAFADEAVWAVLSTRLSRILEIDYAERGDDNSLIIERILILIRNILYVPADTMEKRPDNDASVHDQVLWALHQSGMLDIILYMSSSSTEQAYYMHILEILSFMLREQTASELASAALQRSQTEKIRDEAELLAMRHREVNEKQKKMKIYTGTRHSRFGGTYVVKSMKSIGDNELIYHKPLNQLDSLNFDVEKKKPKTPKNRLPLSYATGERRSAFSIRLFLKEFCVEFLNGAYNTLMYHVKENLVRAKAQAHDESYYLWALRFFMEFNRCYKFEVKLISETMSVQTFRYVQQQSENYFDLMQTDKKKLKFWSRRLHLAVLAYRELFFTLSAMDKSPDGMIRDSAKVIKSNIFYVLEYREFVLTLLIMYDELKMADVYLKDLMETQHIFIKMLENFCAKEGTVVVQKRGTKKRKKQTKSKANVTAEPVEKELNLEGKWDIAAPQLSAVLERGTDYTTDVVPFDAASDVPIDDQKSEAMKNIQRKLRSNEFEAAIGLLHAAREVWPENDSFGNSNMAPEEEYLALRDIFFADLGENNLQSIPLGHDLQEHSDEDHSDEDEEEEDELRINEADFKFEDFTKRLAHPKIIRACGLALRNFDKNSVNTNHCIVKLLHRIAFDCKMYVMVFQLSIFRTFQRIFAMKDFPEHKELIKFASFMMRKFFTVAEKNKKVFMEALFWKSTREAYDIENGYEAAEKSTAAVKAWSEEEEDELRHLFMEHQQANSEEDIVDWIVNNLINNTRTRRAVLKKLKEMCLIVDYKGRPKSGVRSKFPQNWSAEEETQLQELYEQFKDANDPLGCIMSRLEISRPKNRIVEKMLVMGLIQDKKELRKKRAKAGRKSQQRNEQRDSASSNSSDSEDDNATVLPRPVNKKNSTGAPRKKTATKNKRKPTNVTASKSQLAKTFISLKELGLEDSLGWLKESIQDAIEDSEDGNNEGIPLVPIMDYAVDAMENTEFQLMLKSLGICEPFDEQESYWRIPGDLPVAVLTNYVTLIEHALDGSLTLTEDHAEDNITSRAQAEESSDEDIFDKLRKITTVTNDTGPSTSTDIHRKILVEGETENGDNNIIEPGGKRVTPTEFSEANTQRKKSRLCIQSDDDSREATVMDAEEEDSNNVSSSHKVSSRKIIDSDNEENDSMTDDKQKRSRCLSDSDSEMPAKKRGRLIDSDSE